MASLRSPGRKAIYDVQCKSYIGKNPGNRMGSPEGSASHRIALALRSSPGIKFGLLSAFDAPSHWAGITPMIASSLNRDHEHENKQDPDHSSALQVQATVPLGTRCYLRRSRHSDRGRD